MHIALLFSVYLDLSVTTGANLDYYYGGSQRQMCYSCMSTDKEQTWTYLQHVYYRPKNFTDHCNRPMIPYGIGLVPCASACVVITEMRLVSGHFAGYSFTRGCIHSIAKNGFRNTTIRDYHLELRPTCERLPRNVIFYKSNPTIEDQIYFCTCFGDRCNDDRSSAAASYHFRSTLGDWLHRYLGWHRCAFLFMIDWRSVICILYAWALL